MIFTIKSLYSRVKKWFNKSVPFENEDFMLLPDDINQALIKCGYPPSQISNIKTIADELNREMINKNECAMIIAHIFHETGGLIYLEEIFALSNPEKAQKQYFTKNGIKGKSYHGRGLIMLSWPENYLSASKALNMGDRLLKNPELVAQDFNIALKTALWYWKSIVRKSEGFCSNRFHPTTLAINGSIECFGAGYEKAKERYAKYVVVAKVFNVNIVASMN